MIDLINVFTGTTMQVADERLEEYLAAGHKLAAPKVSKPAEVADDKPRKVVKATVKKATTKKK